MYRFLFPCLDFEQCAGKYTVMADYEGGAQELSVKSGDMVQLVKEGDGGQWWENSSTAAFDNIKIYSGSTAIIRYFVWLRRFVRNLSSSKDGWIAAANLVTLVSKSKSCQSLTSSGIQIKYPKKKSVWHKSSQLLSKTTSSDVTLQYVFVFLTEGSGSGNLSTSSSCSETYTSFSDIKPWTALHFLRHQTTPTNARIMWLSVLCCQLWYPWEICQGSSESCIFSFFKIMHRHQLR